MQRGRSFAVCSLLVAACSQDAVPEAGAITAAGAQPIALACTVRDLDADAIGCGGTDPATERTLRDAIATQATAALAEVTVTVAGERRVLLRSPRAAFVRWFGATEIAATLADDGWFFADVPVTEPDLVDRLGVRAMTHVQGRVGSEEGAFACAARGDLAVGIALADLGGRGLSCGGHAPLSCRAPGVPALDLPAPDEPAGDFAATSGAACIASLSTPAIACPTLRLDDALRLHAALEASLGTLARMVRVTVLRGEQESAYGPAPAWLVATLDGGDETTAFHELFGVPSILAPVAADGTIRWRAPLLLPATVGPGAARARAEITTRVDTARLAFSRDEPNGFAVARLEGPADLALGGSVDVGPVETPRACTARLAASPVCGVVPATLPVRSVLPARGSVQAAAAVHEGGLPAAAWDVPPWGGGPRDAGVPPPRDASAPPHDGGANHDASTIGDAARDAPWRDALPDALRPWPDAALDAIPPIGEAGPEAAPLPLPR